MKLTNLDLNASPATTGKLGRKISVSINLRAISFSSLGRWEDKMG
jgi:hypothetical protein